jgi:hypothetical protein
MVELRNVWPEGFQNGQLDSCPSGLSRHSNGGGCAPTGLSSSVCVGPYAQVPGGNVSGNVRIEDHATVVRGTVSGGDGGGAEQHQWVQRRVVGYGPDHLLPAGLLRLYAGHLRKCVALWGR